MWIVRLALRRPYTFVVMAMLIVLLGVFAILHMPTDIFPEVDIPVISVIWQYSGMPPAEMEGRIVRNYRRHPDNHRQRHRAHRKPVDLRRRDRPDLFPARREDRRGRSAGDGNFAGLTRQMPPGIQPPLIMRYSASTVPILQLSLSSNTLPEQQLFDITNNFLRPDLATVQGAMLPWPYGGKQRQIMVDLEPDKLFSYGPLRQRRLHCHQQPEPDCAGGNRQDWQAGIPGASQLQPAGGGGDERLSRSEAMNGQTVYIRDVAHVSDKYMPQTNLVHIDGKKGALEPIYKLGGASTLDIVKRVLRALPGEMPRIPGNKELILKPLFDQSVFVRAAVVGRGQGSGDRRRSHGLDDPAVPGLLAQHADHLYFNSALDPGVDHRPLVTG